MDKSRPRDRLRRLRASGGVVFAFSAALEICRDDRICHQGRIKCVAEPGFDEIPCISQLAGNFGSRDGSLETAPSAKESVSPVPSMAIGAKRFDELSATPPGVRRIQICRAVRPQRGRHPAARSAGTNRAPAPALPHLHSGRSAAPRRGHPPRAAAKDRADR
jgi:hypothetical protein